MRLIELFEGGKENRLSMSRLLMFMSFWPSSFVLITNPTETMLGLYLGAFIGGYVGGKSADIFMGDKQLAADTDSDTVSADTSTSMVVEKRSDKSTGTKRSPV